VASADEWLSVREVARRLEMSVSGVKEAIYRGELEGELRHRPEPGRPPLMVRAKELERFMAARQMEQRVALPEELRDVILPLQLAAFSVGSDTRRLQRAARLGRLRAVRLVDVHGRTPRQWHVRLADLESYLARPEQGTRQRSTRRFDAEMMRQLRRLLEREPAQESGLPLGQAAEA
jgi:hypothetical protein